MKRLIAVGSSILYLLLPFRVFATSHLPTPTPNKIIIERPTIDGNNVGFSTIGDFITKSLAISFIFAVIVVLIMLIWGAFEWITSGGDKDSVAKARNRIINALIGLAVLAVAFALFQVAGSFVGFDIRNLTIPTPAP